jgi:hypothetical protein
LKKAEFFLGATASAWRNSSARVMPTSIVPTSELAYPKAKAGASVRRGSCRILGVYAKVIVPMALLKNYLDRSTRR